MDAARCATVTRLLVSTVGGNEPGAAGLLPLVYDELRELAARHLRRERPDHTLQPTALVHEAYLRLVDQKRVDWHGQTHFLAVAAQAIRRVLVDHARGQKAAKRGGGRPDVALHTNIAASEAREIDVLALEEVLSKLAMMDGRASQIVELRFFGGLTEVQVAHMLGCSERQVRKEWAWARTWLRGELEKGGAE